MFFGTLNEPFIKFKESYDIVYFSSTDSTIEVESTFEHNLKQRKRKHYNKLTIVFSLVSTTQMRYRNDTSLFWKTVLLVGGPCTLRLFSSNKHFRQVNSGRSSKSKYDPKTGNFSFAVLDEKTLRKSRTGIPNFVKCGIIDDAVKLVDKKKEFVLSMDDKQLIPGLINDSEGDVNLWGYEGPPTLQQNLDRLKRHKDIVLDVVAKASIEENYLSTLLRTTSGIPLAAKIPQYVSRIMQFASTQCNPDKYHNS